MPTFGYIRTSRDQDHGHPAATPRCSAASSSTPVLSPGGSTPTSRSQARRRATPAPSGTLLDRQLAQGEVLLVAAVDRLGRCYLETMWAIYDL